MLRPSLCAPVTIVLVLLAAGCDDLSVGTSPPSPQPKKVVKKVATPKESKAKKSNVDAKQELDVIDQAFQKSHTQAVPSGASEELAVRRVTGEIEKYVEVGPTLVVWLVDRTSSSVPLANAALPAARQFYESEMVKQWQADGNRKLLSAVAAVDDNVELLLDPPSDSGQAVRDALEKITRSGSS